MLPAESSVWGITDSLKGEEMAHLVHVVALGGAVVMGLHAATRFVIALWSLRADASGRRHAVRLLRVLGRHTEM